MSDPSNRARSRRPRRLRRIAVLAAGTTASLAGVAAATTPLQGVAQANPKAPGISSADVLAEGWINTEVARGSMKLENGTKDIPYYGYLGDGPMVPAPGAVPAAGTTVEASKTEPDKNTYLVLDGQTGADAAYDYGTHFLFQGHELGAVGSITRINLDADAAHRVTLLAATDAAGKALPTFDGSTWDPFAGKLLFTAELGVKGGVWQATLGVPSTVTDISGATGRAGYEGVQADSVGNLILIEDVGGPNGTVNTKARQPNSFVYRFVPDNPADLTRGKLQVLQVQSLRSDAPITFHAGDADADITSADVKDLHTAGNLFHTEWVTIHDTAVDGTAPFDANAAAKAHAGTPFKRPENGVFRPGIGFTDFFFTETGDTNADTQAGEGYGGFGAVFELSWPTAGADEGLLVLLVNGDKAHTGFDNITFLSDRLLMVAEDAGDTLHTQRNALDSAYVYDTETDTVLRAGDGIRVIAEGRDPSATIDAALSGKPGFQNDGDNEITGIHYSNGDPTIVGLFGADIPAGFTDGWRLFYTAQHGDNITHEIITGR